MAPATGLLREPINVSPDGVAVYGKALRTLTRAQVPYLVGGAWAMASVAGVRRWTKDLDLFVRPEELGRVLGVLSDAGFRTEIRSPVWLAKAWFGELFVDVIFSSGNGIATVDDVWFEQAIPGQVLDVPVLFCPVEETIWSKAWIMERERYDGADVAHLVREHGDVLDWRRLLDRFGDHWRVLYGHLVLFGYVYPGERDRIPGWVMQELGDRMTTELAAPPDPARVCRGLLVSKQFAHDLEELGYSEPPPPPLPNAKHADDRTSRRRR